MGHYPASMTSYEALAAEVDRITTCPYPSQLRTLRDIADQCTHADIAQWAAAKPCLIETLAACLLEGLQQWPYVLDIITHFAFTAACRDAFLRQEPTLLHSAVAHAIKSGSHRERSKYTRASVALLSLPLPDTVALPAEAQTLFIQLVEDAARRPSPITIQPVYIMLSGTGGLLLGVLSSEIMTRFEDHLLEILKNSGSTPDGCLSLYCLAIMNLVCRSTTETGLRLTASSYDTQDFLASTPASSKWKSEAMQQFFTGSKAQKSIQLVVLSAYLASKATSADCSFEKVKSLALANEIIAAIPADIRKIWATANPGMIRKLQERLCAEDVEDKTKTLALRFIGKLCDLDTLPHPVLESLELTFLEAQQLQTVHTLCSHVDDSDLFCGVLSRAPISVLLENAVDYAIRADSAELAAGADAVTRIVSDAQVVVGSQKIAGHQIREMLLDESFTRKLQQLQAILEEQKKALNPGPASSGWCYKALQRTRSRLAHQISNLLLRASQSSSLGSYAMTVLLDLHALSARGDLECAHGRQDWREVVAIADSDPTDAADEHIDWREALHTHFKARAHVEQDAVTRLFAKACADLEARCETVEKPLRDEQERCRALEERKSALSRAFDEIESKYVEATLRIRSLEEKESRQAEDLEDVEDRNARLLERITALEETLRQSQSAAQKQLADIKSANQIAGLDAAARIAQQQEALEDAEDETAQWKAKYKEQATRLSSYEHSLEEGEVEREQLRERLSIQDARAHELERELGRSEMENDRLKTAKATLEEDLHTASSGDAEKLRQLKEAKDELQACRAERDEVKSELARETEDLRAAIERQRQEYAELTDQHKEDYAHLQHQLADAQQDLRDITYSKTAHIESLDAKMADLRKKVERYQRKCHEKDQQIAEAESMRANLMAAMGINKSQAHASLPHRSRDSFASQTHTQAAAAAAAEDSPPSPLAASVEDMDISASNLEQSFISNGGKCQEEDKNGRTPKRQKPRKSLSFAAPLTTTAATKARASGVGNGRLLSRASTGIRQSTGRQPLSGTSGNRASFKPFKTPTKEAELERIVGGEEEEEEEESTFDDNDSELFAGTQGRQMLDLQAAF